MEEEERAVRECKPCHVYFYINTYTLNTKSLSINFKPPKPPNIQNKKRKETKTKQTFGQRNK